MDDVDVRSSYFFRCCSRWSVLKPRLARYGNESRKTSRAYARRACVYRGMVYKNCRDLYVPSSAMVMQEGYLVEYACLLRPGQDWQVNFWIDLLESNGRHGLG